MNKWISYFSAAINCTPTTISYILVQHKFHRIPLTSLIKYTTLPCVATLYIHWPIFVTRYTLKSFEMNTCTNCHMNKSGLTNLISYVCVLSYIPIELFSTQKRLCHNKYSNTRISIQINSFPWFCIGVGRYGIHYRNHHTV